MVGAVHRLHLANKDNLLAGHIGQSDKITRSQNQGLHIVVPAALNDRQTQFQAQTVGVVRQLRHLASVRDVPDLARVQALPGYPVLVLFLGVDVSLILGIDLLHLRDVDHRRRLSAGLCCCHRAGGNTEGRSGSDSRGNFAAIPTPAPISIAAVDNRRQGHDCHCGESVAHLSVADINTDMAVHRVCGAGEINRSTDGDVLPAFAHDPHIAGLLCTAGGAIRQPCLLVGHGDEPLAIVGYLSAVYRALSFLGYRPGDDLFNLCCHTLASLQARLAQVDHTGDLLAGPALLLQ